MTRRTEKVASLLHHEVGEYLLQLELPALTTISKVDISPDLKWCKVWVSILGNPETQKQTLGTLSSNRPALQALLQNKLTMKFVPRVSFVVDHGEEYAAHINELLRKI